MYSMCIVHVHENKFKKYTELKTCKKSNNFCFDLFLNLSFFLWIGLVNLTLFWSKKYLNKIQILKV